MTNDIRRHRVPGSEPGIELALIEWPGSGPPALLHHANGFCAALWAPVAERLASRFRVFAVDARGHGDSSTPDGDDAYAWAKLAQDLGAVADWVRREAGTESIALGLGHSFGGTLTMAAAAATEGLYDRALLVDPVILPRHDSPAYAEMRHSNPMADRARKRRHHWESREAARAFFEEKSLFADWTPRAIGLYIDEALAEVETGVELKCPGRVEAAIFSGSRPFDPYAVAEKARLPVRVLRATAGSFSIESYRDLIRVLPNGELGEIEGGHLVVMERPEAVAAAALEFAAAR